MNAPLPLSVPAPLPPWRDVDWDGSALGAPASWPLPLQVAAQFVADSAAPMCAAWGESLATLYNDAFLACLPGPPAQGAPLACLVAADAQWTAQLGQVLAGRGTTALLDGRACSLVPLRDAEGAVRGMLCTVLADAPAPAREAQEQEERYRLARMASSDAIWDWRLADGHVVWNAALHDLFGHAFEHTSADWWIEHIHPDDRAAIERDIHAVIEGGATRWSAEYRFRRADGHYAEIYDRGAVLRDDAGQPLHMIGAMLDLTGRRAAERALGESERLFRTLFESIDEGFTVIEFRDGPHGPSSDYLHLMANPAFALHTGIERVVGRSVRELVPQEADAWVATYREVLETGKPIRFQRALEETGRQLELAALRIEPAERRQVAVLFQDVTLRHQAEQAMRDINDTLERRVEAEVAERIRAQDSLRQSQKMEAVGQLSGGIAHDFNNMLAVISNAVELLGRRLPADDARTRHYVDMARGGVRRAAQLTQRLLAFSRQQPLRAAAISVNDVVGGMLELLRHALGASIALEVALEDGLWTSFADQGQLENAVINLALNARDAMPEGGRLCIASANRRLGPAEAAVLGELAPGDYVVLQVRDTGTGMAPQVAARAFEPFFTTKEVGRGTGLGLSQVYGFVRQSGGQVALESSPGQGTELRIYLPRHAPAQACAPAGIAAGPAAGRATERVLVVDDDDGVRELVAEMLGELGYAVATADGADAALRVFDTGADIDLVLTDVIMPGMNGRRLADELLRRRPGVKLLFTTGYTRDVMIGKGVLDSAVQMLPKPFSIEELAGAVRMAFDTASPQP